MTQLYTHVHVTTVLCRIIGNFIFWIAFCVVGQPVSVLLYYHDYVVGIRPVLLAMRAAAAGGTPALAASAVGMESLLTGSTTAGYMTNATLGVAAATAGSML